MSDFKANVEVSVLDDQLTALEQRLQSLNNKQIPVKVKINTSDIQNQLNQIANGFNLNINNVNIGNQIRQAGQRAGQDFSTGFDNSISLKNGLSQIQSLQSTLKSMNFKSNAITAVTQDLEKMELAVTKVTSKLSGDGKNLSVRVDGVDQLGRAVSVVKEFNAETGKPNPRNMASITQTFEDLGKLSQKAATYGKELDNLKAKFQNVLNVGNGQTNPFKAMVDGIDFSNITNTAELDAMVERLKAAEAEGQRLNSLMNKKWASNAIEQINKNLQELPSAVTIIEEKFKTLGTLGENFGGSTIRQTIEQLRTDMASINSIDNPEAKIQAYNQLASTIQQLQSKILETQATQRNMFSDTDVSNLQSRLASLETGFAKLGTSGESFIADIRNLRTELDGLGKSDGSEAQINNFRRIEEETARLAAKQRELRAESQRVAASMSFILSNNITTWMNNNTKAAKIYSTQLQDLQNQLAKVETQSDLKNVSNQFRELKTLAASEGNLGKGIFRTLIGNVTKLSPLFGMGTMITTSIRGIKSMYSTVVDLDTALVDLQKTSTATYSQLNDFYNEANNIAKEYGTTTKDIIQSAADWSRLGYNLEDSELMSQYSSMFKSISPGMDIDKATTGLVSVMKAYDVEAEDVLDGIMSKINIIGNTAATSNDQIVTGLEKSSSAMAVMGSTLEENIALFTAG